MNKSQKQLLRYMMLGHENSVNSQSYFLSDRELASILIHLLKCLKESDTNMNGLRREVLDYLDNIPTVE